MRDKDLHQYFLARLMEICDTENIKYDQKVLVELVIKFFPDSEDVSTRYKGMESQERLIVDYYLHFPKRNLHHSLICWIEKNWKGMRKWVGKNSDNDFNTLYRKLFNALEQRLEPTSIPAAVLFIADYQYKSAFAMDSEINFVACLTEIMSECKFK